jgi:hypothetical protein
MLSCMHGNQQTLQCSCLAQHVCVLQFACMQEQSAWGFHSDLQLSPLVLSQLKVDNVLQRCHLINAAECLPGLLPSI